MSQAGRFLGIVKLSPELTRWEVFRVQVWDL